MSTEIAILKVTSGFGRYQKGEDDIVETYPNVKEATKAILKSLQD